MEDVSLTRGRYLGDPAETPELRRIQDPVAISLKRVTRIGATGTSESIFPAHSLMGQADAVEGIPQFAFADQAPYSDTYVDVL